MRTLHAKQAVPGRPNRGDTRRNTGPDVGPSPRRSYAAGRPDQRNGAATALRWYSKMMLVRVEATDCCAER
ncbi:hypothetical protein GCM10009746_00800 [Microbacterium paludicola]